MTNGEFQEIAHCGGSVIVEAKTDNTGTRHISMGFQTSSPLPASIFGINVMENGIPFMTVALGFQTPIPNIPHYPIFIASDSHTYFGHKCPKCSGYWRSRSAPAFWPTTCPYCGLINHTHKFLTDGQKSFVKRCVEMYVDAIESNEDGRKEINLDKIADEISAGLERPDFFYVEESQQNKYSCDACGDNNDILGRFAFCSCCGTRNDVQELNRSVIPGLREKANEESDYTTAVKDAAAAFDALIKRYADFLVDNIPMTPARKERLKGRFLNFEKTCEDFKQIFDIDLLKGFSADDKNFCTLMFHRRHVYVHNGGAVDQKYISDSGDKSVRLMQEIRETKESANKFIEKFDKLARNLHRDFHSIFPPQQKALRKTKN